MRISKEGHSELECLLMAGTSSLV